MKNKNNKPCFTEMSINNQHKYNRCHFASIVICIDTNHNANMNELKAISG